MRCNCESCNNRRKWSAHLAGCSWTGAEKCAIENYGSTLTVKYRNWVCRYQLERGEVIRDTGRTGCNRNGHYKLFRAEGKNILTVRIEIFPADQQLR